jgi:hypothetical protein
MLVGEEKTPVNRRNSDIDGTESEEGAGEANEDSDIDVGKSEEGSGEANAPSRTRLCAALYWRSVRGGVKGTHCAFVVTREADVCTDAASEDRVALSCPARANNDRVLRPGLIFVGKVSGDSGVDGGELEEGMGDANALNHKRLCAVLY